MAIRDAGRIGLQIGQEELRLAALAITDAISGDGWDAGRPATALFRASCPNGCERWTVRLGEQRFDVIYGPNRAQVLRVFPASDHGIPP